jgi:hypothetical protein
LVTVSTVSVTGSPPELEPLPEDPPDEDEPPEPEPAEELDDPEALCEPPLEPFEPLEPLELELELLGEVEVGEDSDPLPPADAGSLPAVVGAGASSMTGAARVTSAAVAAWAPPRWRWWVTCGFGAGAALDAGLAGCATRVVVARVLAVLAVCGAPPSGFAGATAESSWPKPSAAIGHWWNTWAETRTTKRAIARPIRVTPDTAPAK